MDATETSRLAGLPSREVLLAKLLGSMMSPLSGLARFFDGAKKELETKGQTKVGDIIVAAKAAETPVVAAVVEAAPAETPVPEAVVAEAPAAEETPAA